jgi:hypothetical protein
VAPADLEEVSEGGSGGRASRVRPRCCSWVGDGTAGMASCGVPGRPVFLFAPLDLLRERLCGRLVTKCKRVSVCLCVCVFGGEEGKTGFF